MGFEEFLEWYPEDGRRYELIDGEANEMRPVGDHEELASRITRKLNREIERLDLPWKRASTITQGCSVVLVVEVVSTNWQDDNARKLEDYEGLGLIPMASTKTVGLGS
ncbi:MAG: hypothetical protein HC921_08125 [Synechococcaceae cyanobacterium SM2_3_1]|nr:hypothetical protein [Synechococcaceae cyanobacterium SM2_3_1]